MSETSVEEFDYGSPDIDAIPHTDSVFDAVSLTDSDHAWSTYRYDNESQESSLSDKDLLITISTSAEFSSQYVNYLNNSHNFVFNFQ